MDEAVNLHMYLLDALHSRACLMLITNDDGVEPCHGFVSGLGEIYVVVGLGELRLGLDPLLLLGVSVRPARPLLGCAILLQGQSGLRRESNVLG